MSELQMKLRRAIDLIHEVIGELPADAAPVVGIGTGTPSTPSKEENPTSHPPTPETPATQPAAPKQPMSAHISLLAADMLSKAERLPNGGALVKRIKELQQATTNEQAQEAVTSAMGEADNIGATEIVLTLMQIRTIVGGSSEGATEGNTEVAGDMVT